MTVNGWLQIVFYVAVLTALTPLLGHYMARVYTGERVFLTPLMAPVERLFYQAIGARSESGQDWRSYARSVLVFSALSWLLLYLILRTQSIQPFNPEGFGSAPWDVTFNTTSSFVSNTNWQFYGGETTMSYFSQMVGLAVQNFVSAAVGMAVLVAVIRGIISRGGHELGNFWVDLTRSLLYILLPLSIVGAVILVSRASSRRSAATSTSRPLEGAPAGIALGPVASQIAIKQLGTNGGGFFNVNSAIPFENPTALSNFVEVLVDPPDPGGADVHLRKHGRIARARAGRSSRRCRSCSRRLGVVLRRPSSTGSPAQHAAGISAPPTARRLTGGNLEGKEQRFGIANSTALGDGHDRRLERLGQLRPSSPTPASAARCRWSTC